MANEEKPTPKPDPAALAERLKSVQDQADKIGPVGPELNHKKISDWVCADGPTGRPDAT